jgi:cyclophilin family peptidyl-prolyl cis-trans isomerase
MSRHLLPSLLSLLLTAQASATIVELDFSIGAEAQPPVYIDLFEDEAPATVANFLNYIDAGAGTRRYDGTFVHRSAVGFVLQLGGYQFDPGAGSFAAGGVSHIPVDAPVNNEFSSDRSNLRGTIAMAKLDGDPDSATSEWFFNLDDNAANLDNQNGGFTVFGRVLGTGMDTIDAIAALEVRSVASFSELPVVEHTPGDPVAEENLVTLERINLTLSPTINVDARVAVGDVMVGSVLEGSFGIRNPGGGPLFVSSKEIIGADAALFTLGDVCTDAINPGSGCRESLTFSPLAAMASIDASIRLSTNDPDDPVVEIPIMASVSNDSDGIADAIEALAANAGDGNDDAVADAFQAHVASLPDINGDYVTLEVLPGQTLTAVSALENPSPDNAPVISAGGSLTFDHGFYSFTIEDVPVGGTASVTLHLPANSTANSYFMFGPVPANPFSSQWYRFDSDGEIGARFEGNRVIITLIDGGLGDRDLDANGSIADPGGPATITTSSSSSGGGGGCSMRTQINTSQSTRPIDLLVLAGFLAGMRFRKHISRKRETNDYLCSTSWSHRS